MRKAVFVFALLVVMFTSGCVYVTAADKAMIRQHQGNADMIYQKILQLEDPLPPWAINWWQAEVDTWNSMVLWSNGGEVVE